MQQVLIAFSSRVYHRECQKALLPAISLDVHAWRLVTIFLAASPIIPDCCRHRLLHLYFDQGLCPVYASADSVACHVTICQEKMKIFFDSLVSCVQAAVPRRPMQYSGQTLHFAAQHLPQQKPEKQPGLQPSADRRAAQTTAG